MLPIPSVDSTQIRPPCCSMMWRAMASPRPGPAGLATDAGPVHLVEPLEDAGLGGPRDADAVVGHGHDDLVGDRIDRDANLAAVGAELHRVVEQVDQDLSEPVLVPVDCRQWRAHVGRQGHPLALGEQAQPPDGRRGQRTEVDRLERSQRSPTLDAGQVEQLADHLDEMPGLDLDVVDPFAHPPRDGITRRLRFASERLGQQADGGERGAELVRQVVDELGPDLLEAPQLRDVLEHEPDGPRRHPASADRQLRTVGAGDGHLAGGGARRTRPDRDGLDPGVEEDLDQRPADQRARGTVEEDVGGRVRLGDAQAIADDQDSLREGAEEGIPFDLGRGSRRLGRERPVTQPRHGRRRVSTGRHAGLDGDPVKAAPGPQGDAGRGGRADDGHDDHDRDQPRLHGTSIAQALGTVWPSAPTVSLGRAGGPAAQDGRRAGIAGATGA